LFDLPAVFKAGLFFVRGLRLRGFAFGFAKVAMVSPWKESAPEL
jgi:hypothetical protein